MGIILLYSNNGNNNILFFNGFFKCPRVCI